MFIGTDKNKGTQSLLAQQKEHIWGSDIHQLVAMGEGGNSVAKASISFKGN